MLHHLTAERLDELESARPARLITLFYDQAIESLHVAISAIARKDIEDRCNAITAAIELLSGMLQCMDSEKDDEIGVNIHRIHSFIIVRLPRVNLHNDAKFLAEAIRLLKPLREAFATIDRHAGELQGHAALQAALRTGQRRPKLSVVSPAS